MKPQWYLLLGTASFFFGVVVGVITSDIPSMLGAGVLFFAVSIAIGVWLGNRKKAREAPDEIHDASSESGYEEKVSEGNGDPVLFERDPFDRDRMIDTYISELKLPRDKAENLYDAGYTGWKDFSEAIPEDLLMVKGINPTIARRIISTVRSKMDF